MRPQSDVGERMLDQVGGLGACRPIATLSPSRMDLPERRYAVDLLNRADVVLSADRIAIVAKVVRILEGDILAMLANDTSRTLHKRWNDVLIAIGEDIEDGAHRPTRGQTA